MATALDNSVKHEEVQGPLENIGEEPTVHDHLFLQNKLSILLIGKTGVGKSSLVNSLLGTTVNKIHHGPRAADHDIVEKSVVNVANIEVTIYDTRGLADPKSKDVNILSQFKTVCEKVDIVFICHDMISRMDDTSVRTSQILSKGFDEKIWEKCILVLTKANLCVESWADACDDNHNDIPLLMVKQMKEYAECFKEYLIESGVPNKITEDIPVCVAGNKKSVSLPGFDNWIAYLYHACSLRSLTNYALQAVATLTKKRNSIKAGALSGALIGAVVASLTIVGIPLGVTVGALIGGYRGAKTFEEFKEGIRKKIREEHDLVY